MKKYNYDNHKKIFLLNHKKILLLFTFLVVILLLWEVYRYLYLKNKNNIFNIIFIITFSLLVIIYLLNALYIISNNSMHLYNGLLGLCYLYLGLRFNYNIEVLFGLFLVLYNAYCWYTSYNDSKP